MCNVGFIEVSRFFWHPGCFTKVEVDLPQAEPTVLFGRNASFQKFRGTSSARLLRLCYSQTSWHHRIFPKYSLLSVILRWYYVIYIPTISVDFVCRLSVLVRSWGCLISFVIQHVLIYANIVNSKFFVCFGRTLSVSIILFKNTNSYLVYN